MTRPGRLIHFRRQGPSGDDLGKAAHPRRSEPHDLGGRRTVVFVHDYDIKLGRLLVPGADIWLNNPRAHEASGTSGEKAVLNGGLNCSVLDGWWAEMYDGGQWLGDQQQRRGRPGATG